MVEKIDASVSLQMSSFPFTIDPSYINKEVKNNALVLPKEFLRYLATISVGTARGIQHAKTQGTILNALVIPPINLMNLDIQDFKLEKMDQ